MDWNARLRSLADHWRKARFRQLHRDECQSRFWPPNLIAAEPDSDVHISQLTKNVPEFEILDKNGPPEVLSTIFLQPFLTGSQCLFGLPAITIFLRQVSI